MAASPQTEAIIRPNDHVGVPQASSQRAAPSANIPPAAHPLSFQTYYGSVNDRSAILNGQHVASWHQKAFIPPAQSASGPRRGSFPDILPHGLTPPPPINDNVLNLRGGMSDLHRAIPGPDDVQTDSDPEFRLSTPSSRMSRAPRSFGPSESADASTIVVTSHSDISGAMGNEPLPAIKGSGSRRNKNYVLPDGSVVSGKGLGRGRPGIKRGPRKSQTGDQSTSQTMSAKDVDAASRDIDAPKKKRKSTASETTDPLLSTVDSVMSGSEESSEEYNPTAHTRFGRQTQKPTTLVDIVAASVSPSSKLSRHNSTIKPISSSPASIKTHPKIKRRVYRGREQFALCEHCLRGFGPPGNVIVFCDACNKCWHQRCHEPQISKMTVSDSKADWYCADCDRILHGKKKDKKTNVKGTTDSVTLPPPVIPQIPTYAGPLIGGRFLKPEQKLAYLKTLSKEDLVSRLMHAADLAPDLPLFQMVVPPPPPPVVMPQAQFTSTYVTPVSKVPHFGNKENGEDDEVDEGYDGYFDEHAALYPKTGQGLQLPAESEDLHMLLEGQDSKTFSHWVRR